MGPRELATKIIPPNPRDQGNYDGLLDGLDDHTKKLNIIMGAVIALNVLDKAKGSIQVRPAIKTEMEHLREAIGQFSDAPDDIMVLMPVVMPINGAKTSPSESLHAAAELALRKISRYSKKLAVAILYKPGLALKGDPGVALDAAVLSMLLTLVDAGAHVPPWDAPMSVIAEQAKANRLVVKKMASLMADSEDKRKEESK